jgi:hypothetical protein
MMEAMLENVGWIFSAVEAFPHKLNTLIDNDVLRSLSMLALSKSNCDRICFRIFAHGVHPVGHLYLSPAEH